MTDEIREQLIAAAEGVLDDGAHYFRVRAAQIVDAILSASDATGRLLLRRDELEQVGTVSQQGWTLRIGADDLPVGVESVPVFRVLESDAREAEDT